MTNKIIKALFVVPQMHILQLIHYKLDEKCKNSETYKCHYKLSLTYQQLGVQNMFLIKSCTCAILKIEIRTLYSVALEAEKLTLSVA